MEIQELLYTAARGAGLYLFMLVILRLLGKRSIGNFSPFDLLVALMLGEVSDEIVYGDVSLLQGGVAILVIAALDYCVGWLTYANHSMDKLLEGVPTVVVSHGVMQKEGMKKERMSDLELMMLLRQQSIDDLREVKLAVVEDNGELSVIKEDWAEPVQKGDLGGREGEQMQLATGGNPEPPEEKNTISQKLMVG